MNYSLEIAKNNVPAHLDIEKEVQLKKNGLFTFTIRVNNGDISDLNCTEYVNINTYRGLKPVAFSQFSIALDNSQWGQVDKLRHDYFQRWISQRGSQDTKFEYREESKAQILNLLDIPFPIV